MDCIRAFEISGILCFETCKLRLDLVERHHPGFHVVIKMAVEHPSTRIIGDHVHCDHLCLHKGNHIGTLAILQHDISVPMWGVNTKPLAETDEIPANALTLFHGHGGSSSIDVSVNRELSIGNRKAGAGGSQIPIGVDWNELTLIHTLRIAGISLNVVVQIPA